MSVPTGLVHGWPVVMQIVSNIFREDRMLAAGEVNDRAAQFWRSTVFWAGTAFEF
jgi:amidase